MGVSSGWAALAGGLLLARSDGVPDVHVWASAAWHEEYGIGKVEGLSEKLTLAAEWGARHMFVPAQNQLDVDQWRSSGGGLSVGLLAPQSRSPDPARLLESYLDRLGTEPLENESCERRRKFYARVNRRRANEFYWKGLLKEAIARCRHLVRTNHPDCQPTHLVTVVSNQAPIIALAPRILEVGHCLLLYEETTDEQIRQTRDQVLESLRQHHIDANAVGIRLGQRDEELEQIGLVVGRFMAGVAAERLAFDLTPGYKSLSLELRKRRRLGVGCCTAGTSNSRPTIAPTPAPRITIAGSAGSGTNNRSRGDVPR